ncbi:unnamed protein product [Peniophora sp. CBMAI 1063]|nr:unnamed protein product [Peniophora sp. CBMAI 1063]
MTVPEVGMFNPPRVYEFFQEFGLLKQPLVKEVDMTETLKSLFGTVNRATGQLDEEAYPAMLQAKSRLKRKITYRIIPQEHFMGRDELLLDVAAWDEEVFYAEAIPMVYRIVTTAHANISRYRDLDPVWTDWNEMVEGKYQLEGIPMRLPTALGRDNCFKYLRHWFDLGSLKFLKWRRKNGLMMAPVELEERWWIDSYRTPGPDGAAMPDAEIPPTAQETMNHVPDTPAVEIGSLALSPYGSKGALIHRVHQEALWDEDLIEWIDIRPVSDPDDRLPQTLVPPGADEEGAWVPPCAVPSNPEAMAQWSLHTLQTLPASLRRFTRHLRGGICQLAELPLVPNTFFSLRAASKYIAIPDHLRWTIPNASSLTRENLDAWRVFLMLRPWSFEHGGQVRFSGLDTAWVFVLGSVLFLQASGWGALTESALSTSPGTADYRSLDVIFQAFEESMDDLAREYEYPGCPPSMKYGLASTRAHYLAYLVRNEDALIYLLRCVTRMDDGPFDSSAVTIPSRVKDETWITRTNGVPSWHWPRCGLPNGAHMDPNLHIQILSWLERDDIFIDQSTGQPRSRETGLAVMLKAALILADVEHVLDGNFEQRGAEQLSDSTILDKAESVRVDLGSWAERHAERLDPLLKLRNDEGLDIEDDDGALDHGAMPDALHLREGSRTSRRGSETPPASSLAQPFAGLDVADVERGGVGDFRAFLAAEPLSAAQVYSKRGLENIANEPVRREANRLARQAGRKSKETKGATRTPASQRQRPAAYLLSDGESEFETAGQEDRQDATAARRKREHPRAKRVTRASTSKTGLLQTSDRPGAGPSKRRKGVQGPKTKKKDARGAGTSTEALASPRHASGSAAAGPAKRKRSFISAGASRKRRRMSDKSRLEDESSARVPSRSVDSRSSGSDSELPRRLTRSAPAPVFPSALPAVFDAEGSSGSGIDSEELRSATSARPSSRRRVLSFVSARARQAVRFLSVSSSDDPTAALG